MTIKDVTFDYRPRDWKKRNLTISERDEETFWNFVSRHGGSVRERELLKRADINTIEDLNEVSLEEIKERLRLARLTSIGKLTWENIEHLKKVITIKTN